MICEYDTHVNTLSERMFFFSAGNGTQALEQARQVFYD
jgi:hypothetical protein